MLSASIALIGLIMPVCRLLMAADFLIKHAGYLVLMAPDGI